MRHVVCLVGTTKPEQKEQYRLCETELTKKGYVVFTVVWFKDQLENFEEHRPLLEAIHFEKIRVSDAVVLIDKNAVGENTEKEIEFARNIGKPVVTFTTPKKTADTLWDMGVYPVRWKR